MSMGLRTLVLAGICVHGVAFGQFTHLESLSSSGTQGNSWSQDVRISGDARWLIFTSGANNLVSGDNGGVDIFIRDRQLESTIRISTTPNGLHPGGNHYRPDMTPDARYIVWDTDSNNVLGMPTSGRQVVFRDRDADADGIYDESGSIDSELISANILGLAPLVGQSTQPSISADGRYVAFTSEASDLVPIDLNLTSDIFLRDRLLDVTVCVSRGLNGLPAIGGLSNSPSISQNGQYIVFQSNASNLVPGDTNGTSDVFRYNVSTGAIERVSLAWDGSQLAQSSVLSVDAAVGPSVSGGGRYVVFQTISNSMVGGDSNNAVDVFVRDMNTGVLKRMSVCADGSEIAGISQSGTISTTGRFVIFSSAIAGIVPNDNNRRTDVFMHDRDPDENGVFDEQGSFLVRRVSVTTDGNEGSNSSFGGRMCDDGSCVAFASAAALTADDRNGFPDVYFAELGEGGCPADWNGSAGVDSDDVIQFFGDWEMGEADIDHSGGTDSDDVMVFFGFWDGGC